MGARSKYSVDERKERRRAWEREWDAKRRRARGARTKADLTGWTAEEKRVRRNAMVRARRVAEPEKIRAQFRKARDSSRASYNAGENARRKKQRKEDPHFAMECRLRTRLSVAIRQASGTKSAATLELVGCDVEFLIGYIEARFLPGMSWKNRHLWHIDYRIPCARFDLTDPEQQRQCFHYSNLQPLWKIANLSKGDKAPAPHQAELL